jgi:hypothetical protein
MDGHPSTATIIVVCTAVVAAFPNANAPCRMQGVWRLV